MTTTAQITLAWVLDRCIVRDGCWLWQHSVAYNGLPRVSVIEAGRKGSIQIRRRMWEVTHPDQDIAGLFVGSCCTDKRCVNPKHLILRTKAEINEATWRQSDTRARRTRAAGEAGRSRAKLDFDKARYIRASDKTLDQLKAELGVSLSLLSKVRRGMAWCEPNPFAGLMAANEPRQRSAA